MKQCWPDSLFDVGSELQHIEGITSPFVNEQVKESITDVALVEPQLNLPDRIAPAPLFEYDGAELALLPSFPVEEVPQTFDTPYLALSGLSPGLAEPELLPPIPRSLRPPTGR
jgi:hypothetical protein